MFSSLLELVNILVQTFWIIKCLFKKVISLLRLQFYIIFIWFSTLCVRFPLLFIIA